MLRFFFAWSCIFACMQTSGAMDFMDFYARVHTQTMQKNFVRFRHRILVSYEGYRAFLEQDREALNTLHSLVLVYSKIERFIYFNEQSGIGVGTEIGANLQFDIRYYENLKDIGLYGDIKAMCVLPYFDKCILLGYEMF